jgi:hypothetical protein
MIPQKFPIPDRLLVVLWGALLFLPFLGAAHLFDWDEINFAESAREMLVTGNYQQVQINYKPFMEKPPLFFWLQALSMQVLGVNEFAARLPNALIGVITLLVIFNVASKAVNRDVAWLWVLFTTGSFTPHLYFKSGIIDPLYNLFIFLSLVQLYYYVMSKKARHAALLGVFLGLAIITKGPVAVIVISLCFLVYWIMQRFALFFKVGHIALAVISALAVSAIWFGVETVKNGPVFLLEFIKYQADLFLNPVAGHGQPFWYHPVVLLIGCFPASIIALPYLIKQKKTSMEEDSTLIQFMQLLFWVVLILFSIVETKIVHYSSLCYLPLTFLAAFQMHRWAQGRAKHHGWQTALVIGVGSLIAILFTLLPLVDFWKASIIRFINDPFAVASLSVSGGWQGWEWIAGLLFLVLLVFTTFQIRKQHLAKPVFHLLVFISFFIPLLLKTVVPHIERYSQGPAIDWYIALSEKDVYVETAGFKSYAQYFYAKVKPCPQAGASLTNYIQNGAIDKDAYLVVKLNNFQDHINPAFKEVERKGGFILFKREKVQP